MTHPVISRPLQSRFLTIPQSPVCYWLCERFFELLAGRTLGDVAEVPEGIGTGHDARFVRWTWETQCSSASRRNVCNRWVPLHNAGGYRKWAGNLLWAVDWQYSGARIRAAGLPGTRIQNISYLGRAVWVYSYVARGSLGLREVAAGEFFSKLAPALATDHLSEALPAVLNCRFSSWVIRSISAKIQLTESYVARVPLPEKVPGSIATLQRACLALKKHTTGVDPREQSFSGFHISGSTLTKAWQRLSDQMEAVDAVLHSLEGLSEREVFTAYAIGDNNLQAILDETGVPVGWYPVLTGYGAIPPLPVAVSIERALLDLLARRELQTLSADSPLDHKRRLRALYQAEPGVRLGEQEWFAETLDQKNEEDESGLSDAPVSGARIPIPPETFLEELSQKLEIHPISVYWLLREMRDTEGVVSKPELVRFVEDYTSVLVLRLLGHQWPREVESRQPQPTWADPDGIIPLTEGLSEPSLVDRFRDRLAADFGSDNSAGVEREFQEVTGKLPEAWLTTDFFKRHVSQFRKRPIAWQIESQATASTPGRGTRARRNSQPAFSGLVYYHKIDGDMIPKVRTHYVIPLQKRCETEMRTLEAVESPNPDQQARKVQLDNWVQELKAFDEKLGRVATHGFGPQHLLPRLRQYAIDDAMLSLKARWLRKLAGVIESGPLKDWERAAMDTDLHPEFPLWMREALLNLNHHCSAVNPPPPDQESFPTDPDSEALASIICKEARSMAKRSLALACAVWWSKFDEVVLRPVKDQISNANARIKALNDELKGTEPRVGTARAPEIKQEIKLLKSDVADWKKEIAKRSGLAQTIRRGIEGWSCPEAEQWESWLARQPLYDETTSIDGKRPPTNTIAEFIAQESAYIPDLNDGVRVNIAPLQRAGLLSTDVLAAKDVDEAIADRAEWRADERRWRREGKLPHPGWWKKEFI